MQNKLVNFLRLALNTGRLQLCFSVFFTNRYTQDKISHAVIIIMTGPRQRTGGGSPDHHWHPGSDHKSPIEITD